MSFIDLHAHPSEYVRATFQALTDAILPTKSPIADNCQFNYPDMGVHDYIIYSLNHYISIQQQLKHPVVPLAYPTALMLNNAASQLIHSRKIKIAAQNVFTGGQVFSSLSRKDRIRTLAALENVEVDLYQLPSPFQNNAGFVKYVTDAINRLSLFGYYSEWPAYGSTRLYPPGKRRLEFFPPNWKLVGYPGVALGYRDFRGFLFTMAEVKKTNEKRS